MAVSRTKMDSTRTTDEALFSMIELLSGSEGHGYLQVIK
jgi:hypothetical protein